jgi:hypothetical protein
MRNDNTEIATAALPAPIALTAEELRRVAAGTGVLLGTPCTPIHIYGGIMVPQSGAITLA